MIVDWNILISGMAIVMSVIGSAWVLSAQLARLEAKVSELKEAHGQRLERIERFLDGVKPAEAPAQSD
ncbi:MAG: hypothetical protein ISN29_08515 [Gammaproteobacteria bacterium AqS3]|nr:hypothetical protein [Gammaproteobacteria bacterium AqS3]